MSESEALVSFAAAKLGAARPKCVLVTRSLLLSWKRSRGGCATRRSERRPGFESGGVRRRSRTRRRP
jgi:hypothetical protein